MKYLLDTDTAIWLFSDDPKLGAKALKLFAETAAADIFYSTASLWEVCIKTNIGKIDIGIELEKALEVKGFTSLPVLPEHTRPIASLPLLHRDPFDRMLIAQSLVEDLALITSDKKIMSYPEVTCIDATQ